MALTRKIESNIPEGGFELNDDLILLKHSDTVQRIRLMMRERVLITNAG
jgi:hypothetical protein